MKSKEALSVNAWVENNLRVESMYCNEMKALKQRAPVNVKVVVNHVC